MFEEHLPRVVAIAREQDRLRGMPRDARDADALSSAQDALEKAEAGFSEQFRSLVERDANELAVSAEALSRLLATDYASAAMKVRRRVGEEGA